MNFADTKSMTTLILITPKWPLVPVSSARRIFARTVYYLMTELAQMHTLGVAISASTFMGKTKFLKLLESCRRGLSSNKLISFIGEVLPTNTIHTEFPTLLHASCYPSWFTN